MSKWKRVAVRFVVLLIVLSALTVAFPAFSHEEVCQDGWTLIPDPLNASGKDKNGDGVVCMKMVPGEGNGYLDNTVMKDDHDHKN